MMLSGPRHACAAADISGVLPFLKLAATQLDTAGYSWHSLGHIRTTPGLPCLEFASAIFSNKSLTVVMWPGTANDVCLSETFKIFGKRT